MKRSDFITTTGYRLTSVFLHPILTSIVIAEIRLISN